jgi:endoglucanase
MMFALRVLLTSAITGAVVLAGLLPDVSNNAAFQYNARRQATNGTSKSFNGPYSTQGRDIVDRNGEKATWAGVNWPMSGTHLAFRRIDYELTDTYD